MREQLPLPEMPGYVTLKQAAKILGVSLSRVYQYVDEERLPAVRAGNNIMLVQEVVEQFKPNVSGRPGRPRKETPPWRESDKAGAFITLSIQVQIRVGQQEKLVETLRVLKRKKVHVFPGTVSRYVIKQDTSPQLVSILFVWKKNDLPDEGVRRRALEDFKAELAEVLDWETAEYVNGEAVIHT